MFPSHTAWFAAQTGTAAAGLLQNGSPPCSSQRCPFEHVSSIVSPVPFALQRLMTWPSQRRVPGSQRVIGSSILDVGVGFGVGVLEVEVPPHAEQTKPRLNNAPTDHPNFEAVIATSPR